jgi:hypothetical protein
MRDAPTPFPTTYRLDETCADIAANVRRARAVSAAAIEAIGGYDLDHAQLATIVSRVSGSPQEGDDG